MCEASYGPNPICKGCLSCSKDNGCIRCQHKLFFFLRREGMRQYGECLHSCPSGYYGLRTPDMNSCSRCKIENCDSCFSRDFCTKCKAGFYLHRGRCFRGCPPGFAALEELMECVEGCEVGQWSEWGTCSRNNKTCGFKWGLETRTRQIVKKPAKDTIPCPTIAESRRCKMAMRHCPGDYITLLDDQGGSQSSVNEIWLLTYSPPFSMCLKFKSVKGHNFTLCLTDIPQDYELHQCTITAAQAASNLDVTDEVTYVGDHQVQ
ncbi:R-spondin-2 [Willisornis vidua]|nr:R-spondin-2 [Willisornis vidua]